MTGNIFSGFTGYIPGEQFNQDVPGETRYRTLKESFKIDVNDENWVLMPFIPIHHMRILHSKVIKLTSPHHPNIG